MNSHILNFTLCLRGTDTRYGFTANLYKAGGLGKSTLARPIF